MCLLLIAQHICLVSCATNGVDKAISCEAAFYQAIDAGHVNTVNGLAIEPEFEAHFFTERFQGRARIVRRQCEDGRLLDALPVFPPGAGPGHPVQSSP